MKPPLSFRILLHQGCYSRVVHEESSQDLEVHMAFTLKVNKQSRTIDVPGEMPLLWVLRDVLGLKGTKYGCGISACGACTGHVDGRAVRSCVTPVSSVENRNITTIEGLAD